MNKNLRKTTYREIKQTFGRFFAIFAIIALGVGFFSGVRITTPAMVHTVDVYFRDNQLFDYRLVSTLGWEEEDVEAIRKQQDVRYAEGSYSVDVICVFPENNVNIESEEKETNDNNLMRNESNSEYVFKFHSLPEDINKLQIVKGRLPEAEDECVVDSAIDEKPEVGEEIEILDTNEEDTLDMFKKKRFKVVGWVDSSYYINFERGTTSIGTGTINGFLYVPKNAFDSDIYTEIFVKFDQDYVLYSKQYKDYMKEKKDEWESISEDQAEKRYERLIDDANQKIADGEQELKDKKADGEKELRDAKKELDDGKKKLKDADEELADARETLDDSKVKLGDASSKLVDAKAELDDGKKELDDAKSELEKAEKELNKGKAELDDAKSELEKAKEEIDKGKIEIAAGQTAIDTAKAALEASDKELTKQEEAFSKKEAEYKAQMEMVKPMWDSLPADQKTTLTLAGIELEAGKKLLTEARTQLEDGKSELKEKQEELDKAKKELESGKKKYLEGEEQYEKGKKEYDKGVSEYEKGKKKYEEGLAEYEKGKNEYENGLAEYYDGKRKYEDGEKEYEDGLKEYEDGVKEYEDGLKEYEDGVKEFDEKIADAEKKIEDAKADLADVESPDTFVLERNTNIGYACFENDSEIVAQVAKVFPVFFVLVAALVCITTMSRMVEEQRTQIGVLKALGYSEQSIMSKYMFYSGSAAFLGCLIGYPIGIILFPGVIWHTYQLMYHALPMNYVFDWKLALCAFAAAMICSLGTTWMSCRYELGETAASLMRPKAPKAGKRVLLEYVPVIWNRLKFLHKISIRNLFRYKRRFFMMIIGIGGCTALLIAGFGIRDSVGDFAEVQYGEILIADASISIKDVEGDKIPEELEEVLKDNCKDSLLMYQGSWDMLSGDYIKETTLISLNENEGLERYMRLHTKDGKELGYPGPGEVYLCEALSERYDAKIGDEVIFRNEDMKEVHVKVAGVFENHVYNYAFISKETMEKELGETLNMNAAFMNFPDGEDIYKAQAAIGKNENVTAVTLYEEFKERMSKMMSRLDYIVLVVICSAAGLAFVVLYNLTNINITERLREIATIKVLGFFRKETSAYVFRENFALTAIGAVFGLGLGILFHRYIMSQLIVDMVAFKTRILPATYIISTVLTFVFTIIVNAVMELKLEKINMAESLKSVE
ncbi:putative ABC transport system permease protein [Lachnospiraceae bacterium]|nr:putative ABC transport system permease protein [Lachnospiraceae bacterium]